jgi:hypothetical protein
MGTLKSVCTSWSGPISRDIYEHTHLRLWMCVIVFIDDCRNSHGVAEHKLYHCKLKQWKLLEKLHELCIATFLQSPSKWSRKLAAVHEIIFRLIFSVKNLQQVLILMHFFLVSKSCYKLHKALTKKEGPNVCWNDDKLADELFRVGRCKKD